MDYAEASYFDGYHFQHIAAWREHLRLARKRLQALDAYRRANYGHAGKRSLASI